MNNFNWLIIELADAPENELLATWLAELLVSERDMQPTEAARHVAQVQQLGRVAAELLAATTPAQPSFSRRRAKSR